MNFENSIMIVTDTPEVAEKLKPQLVLLREIDSIHISEFDSAIDNTVQKNPEAILIYSKDNEKTLNLIKEIHNQLKTPIMLLLEEYNEDFVLNAYDEGISDFLVLHENSAEILMRTIWCLKKNTLSREFKKHYALLEQLDVIDAKSGFYSEKNAKMVYQNEFSAINKSQMDAVFMCVSPNEESKTKLNRDEIVHAIKKSIRGTDIAANSAGNKFYILLMKTNLKGAFIVWERIKKNIGEEYTLSAGICPLDKFRDFEEIEKDTVNALCEAISTKNDLIVVNNTDDTDNWLDKINSSQKNFKLFKQAFNKKLEKVITPVFFQMQKAYEEKLFDTQIEQYSNSSISAFGLKKGENVAELRITYPGFSKINIDIIFKGLDSPENKRINLDLTEIDEQKLITIIEDFIKEFKNYTKE